MLFKKGSRRTDHRYLVARPVDKLQGRARLSTKKEDLSVYHHDSALEQFLSYIQKRARIQTHHEDGVALRDFLLQTVDQSF